MQTSEIKPDFNQPCTYFPILLLLFILNFSFYAQIQYLSSLYTTLTINRHNLLYDKKVKNVLLYVNKPQWRTEEAKNIFHSINYAFKLCLKWKLFLHQLIQRENTFFCSHRFMFGFPVNSSCSPRLLRSASRRQCCSFNVTSTWKSINFPMPSSGH